MSESAVFSKLVKKLLTVCGCGQVIVTGSKSAACAPFFWCSTIPARALATLQDFFETEAGKIDTVLCLDLAFDEASPLLEKLYLAAPRYVAVQADLTLGKTTTPAQGIDLWVELFVKAGFRRHPRSFHNLGYSERESPPDQYLLCFERVPHAALAEFSLQRLHENRLLHMDMLRSAGRRSDAHIVRYFEASPFIRPGDTVLDCACGLGYGSYILYSNSRARRVVGVDISDYAIEYAKANYALIETISFQKGNAQDLSCFPDNSFDFIVGFETIEHVPDPEAYLREMFRVLRPAGRIMLSAPNAWVDETGKDPNPHHFHVYDWKTLYSQVSALFIPEKGFLQTAGGAMKLPDAIRQWREIPCLPNSSGEMEDAEWVLLTAMKDPLLGRTVPYVETTFPHSDDPAYHVCAFGKDYLNPWLLKGIISIGFRLENIKALAVLQERVLAEYPQDSVDYGAALCGKAYTLLSQLYSDDEANQLITQIENYASTATDSPHVLRWQISLLYVAALILRARGRLPEAETYFLRCAERDVAPYSPLLGNKTLDALFFAAEIAIAKGDAQAAENRLRLAMKEAIRLAQGDWLNVVLHTDSPLEPGFPEMAQLMDKAARACYALGELGSVELRPGLVYCKSKGWYETIVEYASQAAVAVRDAAVTERDAAIIERDAAIVERDAAIVERDAAIVERDAAIVERESAIAERKASASYENSRSWKLTFPIRKVVDVTRRFFNVLNRK